MILKFHVIASKNNNFSYLSIELHGSKTSPSFHFSNLMGESRFSWKSNTSSWAQITVTLYVLAENDILSLIRYGFDSHIQAYYLYVLDLYKSSLKKWTTASKKGCVFDLGKNYNHQHQNTSWIYDILIALFFLSRNACFEYLQGIILNIEDFYPSMKSAIKCWKL